MKTDVPPGPSLISSIPNLVKWRDLVELKPREKVWELSLSAPWLCLSLWFYHHGWWWAGAPASFYFFLTGLRQSHNAQHYALGLSRRLQDAVLFILSIAMLASMHAVQVTHLHHHRHCLEAEDVEGDNAHNPWWRTLLTGPLFPFRLHRAAWRLAAPDKRRWILAELATIVIWIFVVVIVLPFPALQWHVAAMLLGECLTGFFAVWTVHHDCDPAVDIGRTQRRRWLNALTYHMFLHLEHHLFPAVPTAHLPQLAERIDQAAPEFMTKQVLTLNNRQP